ncbi:hypothetical protein FA15DRAFT_654668 [Coprinopsis marcescibilis]|nr:hypothetical protein FA15DRAFT_654668 [Coprinopsis marcescibilis]
MRHFNIIASVVLLFILSLVGRSIAHHPTEQAIGLSARELSYEFDDYLEARDILSQFTSRELYEELKVRGSKPNKRKTRSGEFEYLCLRCGGYFTAAALRLHRNTCKLPDLGSSALSAE